MRADTVIKMSVQRMVCTSCGAEANASCNCGKAYLPAKQRAAEAIAANPQKSNRAIADELGIGHVTVKRARDELGVSDETPERVGKDGKVYRLSERKEAEPTPSKEAVEGFFTLAELALRVTDLDFSLIKPTEEMRRSAVKVIQAWQQIERRLA